MKILRKLFITIPLLIVILLIAAVVLVGLFADRAVKLGIEKGGSAALPVGVKVGSVDVSILGGKLALHDLAVENPQGYKYENLLELKDGSVGVNIKSLLSDTIKIKQIKLDGAVVVLEQKDLIHNNIKDILKALPKDGEDKAPTEGETAVEGKKLHIDELIISNTTVKLKLLPIPGKIDTVPLKLGTITMTDLGGDNKLDTARLVRKILSALFEGIAEQGKGILPDDLMKGITGELNGLIGESKVILKEGAKILEGAGDAGKKIGEGLKGLLPGNKEE
jgi:hypothetical protein